MINPLLKAILVVIDTNNITMNTISNYQIIQQIYESTHSLVYRGLRNQDNQPVILKMLKPDYPTATDLMCYRQEYEMIHNLNLPGVIKAYAQEKYQNTLVIILEDFGGESLKQLMTVRPFTLREFLPIVIQIADSLGDIHTANIIHKDINPSNIVWEPVTKQLKIIDFGIASRLPREQPILKNPEHLEGTLAYISPEQTGRINRRVDYRTDLYSLGVTFYEMLAERVPFESTDSLELVHCHIAKIPVPVCKVNPDVPPILSDIVMKLMAKNVDERYQSAFGVKTDLEKCLENLEGFGNLRGLSFELAQNDFSGQFHIPQKLYGRDNEIRTLLHTFERVANSRQFPFSSPFTKGQNRMRVANSHQFSLTKGRSEMMLVVGYSGVGKTTLVHEIQKPITEKRGYFISGKFEQYQRNIPYSALTQAFNEFCNYLLTERQEQLNQWRKRILKAVGSNGQVLIDVIPSLELIIGKQAVATQVGPIEAQNRFLMVFQNFIRAICRPEHALVLFIDDWQWADLASLNLLKVLMTEAQIQYFLIIVAYRDNEVDATHPFMMICEELSKQQVVISTLTLDNLSVEDINALIADTLHCDRVSSQPLTELVYEKTLGNAFFTTAFLKALYEEALLVFDFNTQHWQWDLEKIRRKGMTNNVIELMASKIQKFSPQTQKLLKLAAGMGNQFDLQTLSIITHKYPPKQLLELLWQAVTEGLLIPLDDNYKLVGTTDEESYTSPAAQSQFKFQHDRIRQAAYALIPEADKPALHLEIGWLLLANTFVADDFEERLFDIVNQLNEGQKLIADEAEKVTLARLNLQAGKKAKESTAYPSAINYFALGIPLLGDSAWSQYHTITFDLYQEQGECEFLSGNFARSEQLLAMALEKARSKFEKANIYVIKLAKLSGQGKYYEAVATAIEALHQFDMNVPTLGQNEVRQQATAEEIALYQENMMNRQIADLWHLPVMQNEEMKVCSQIIAIVLDSIIIIGLPDLLAFYTTKMLNISIQYGLSEFTPFGYVCFAIILSGDFRDYESAFQFAGLALQLNEEKLPNPRFKSKIQYLYAYFSLLKAPISTSTEVWNQAYQKGLERGDFVYVGYALTALPRYIFPTNVKKGLKEAQRTIPFLQKTNNAPMMLLSQMSIGFARSLQGNTLAKTSLNYDNFTEEAFSNTFEKSAPFFFAVYKRYKLQLLTLFNCYEQAMPLVYERTSWIDALGGVDFNFKSNYYLYAGITVAALYPSVEVEKKEEYLNILSECIVENQLLSEQCQINFEHAYLILEAEKARIENRAIEAMHFYDEAIASAKQQGYLGNEALAHELAVQFWLTHQKEDFARIYLKGAHYAYQRWGATAKVKDLEEKYSHLFPKKHSEQAQETLTTSRTSRTSALVSQSISTKLDIDSVIKASQTLSGEMILSRLLEKMMHIVIENAGASSGFLLLPHKEQWFIEAESTVDCADVNVLQSTPIGNSSKVSENIIYYVAHTGENVVLSDAIREGHFTSDPYIVEHRTKSVLCAPLLNQGQLTGILYLENPLTTGAFTPQRLQVLNLLSSQMAISIENARFYSSMARFLPREFLNLLDKTSILDIQLGDQVEKEMTVLFSDIRDFTSLSEKMTPQDNFNFINAYLSRMEPIIHEHHGFIDKYIGDAIMALFPNCADDAVQAALLMLKTLADYNLTRGRPGRPCFNIGIGIHTGKLMLGTVGGQNRMDGTVISDAVNLASRIEGMTKKYGANLLISEGTYSRLNDKAKYAIRPLDRVKAKGKTEAVMIYAVSEGFDSTELQGLVIRKD